MWIVILLLFLKNIKETATHTTITSAVWWRKEQRGKEKELRITFGAVGTSTGIGTGTDTHIKRE